MAGKTTFARIRPRGRAHVVAVVALDGVVPFDLAVPCEVFERARLADGSAPYEVRVCGLRRDVRARAFTLRVRHGLAAIGDADTVIVAGVDDVAGPFPPRVLAALRDAAAGGARIASICSGAFVLAATGLLDGGRATTHWLATAELARRHPAIRVDPDVLYVDEGRVLTSAGAASGLDLCLHLVRRDFGAGVAGDAARASVMPLERHGGQSQFVKHAPPTPEGGTLDGLLRWIEQTPAAPLGLASMARRAGTSTRTLTRRFEEQLGESPARWVRRVRVRRAQQLLETTARSIERIAADAGFGSTAAFRAHFRAVVGTSPLAYRAAFRRRSPAGSQSRSRAK